MRKFLLILVVSASGRRRRRVLVVGPRRRPGDRGRQAPGAHGQGGARRGHRGGARRPALEARRDVRAGRQARRRFHAWPGRRRGPDTGRPRPRAGHGAGDTRRKSRTSSPATRACSSPPSDRCCTDFALWPRRWHTRCAVRLEPPRVAVLSMHHYINHGGSEFVVFRATPADVTAGVRVGDRVYAGLSRFCAVGIADPAVRVAVYALLHDQDLTTPMKVFAHRRGRQHARRPTSTRGCSRNCSARAASTCQTRSCSGWCRPFSRTRPTSRAKCRPQRPGRRLPEDQRRPAAARTPRRIAALASKSAPQMLWNGAFQQLGNSQVEAAFADHRTYFHDGKEIDQQVHLGFDLAVTAAVPIVAAAQARSSLPTISASTATASSSTTAWACSRSTRTCRPST